MKILPRHMKIIYNEHFRNKERLFNFWKYFFQICLGLLDPIEVKFNSLE